MASGIRSLTHLAKNLPVARPKLTRAPFISVTVRFNTFFPGVACQDELSNAAKYSHLPITARKPTKIIPKMNSLPRKEATSSGLGGFGGLGKLCRNAPK